MARFSRIRLLLRALAAVATLAAAILMEVTEQQTLVFGVFPVHASYKTSPAFMFFLWGNAIASGYSLLSLLLSACLGDDLNILIHLLDMLMMGGVMGVATGAAAIGYVGKYGNSHIGWMQVCSYFNKYCNHVMYSIGCSYLGFLLLFLVCLLSYVSNRSN